MEYILILESNRFTLTLSEHSMMPVLTGYNAKYYCKKFKALVYSFNTASMRMMIHYKRSKLIRNILYKCSSI